MAHTEFADLVPEGSSRLYVATLKDYAGAAIPLSAISAITLTLRDLATGAIVNGRNTENVLNANGGTMHATSGEFSMVFSAADTASASAATKQRRRATFKVTYTNGQENHEVIFTVYNLADV